MSAIRQRPVVAWIVAALSAVAMAGCGGGGGEVTSDTPADDDSALMAQHDYFPLAVGDRWFYQDSAGAQPYVVRAIGTQAVAGQSGTVVQVSGNGSGSESIYVVSTNGVWQTPGNGADPLITAVGTLQMMRYPLRRGDTYVQIDKTIDSGQDLDGDGRTEPVAVQSVVSVIGLENVSTTAGNFDGSLHLRTVVVSTLRTTRSNQTGTVTLTSDDWLAPEIGPVRSVITNQANGSTETQTLELSGYRVGNRRSDTVAPTVLAVTPADASVQGVVSGLTARFSEPIDSSTVSGAFTLLDAAGNSVTGTVQWDGTLLRFVPSAQLPGGRYTAQLSTALSDPLGNALANDVRWSFEVDATAPGVLGISPADGATEVSRDAAIVFHFSEPVDPASATALSFSLSDSGTSVPFTVRVDGADVTLTPTAALVRDHEYTATLIRDISDLYGNAITGQYSTHFRVEPGRFAHATALSSGVGPEAVLIGDVNGDGRSDVLMATCCSADAAENHKLLVRLQQPDGSLAAAQRLDTRASANCPISSLAVGDVDGDGRPDVVLAEKDCGIEIFRQTADGRLVQGDFLPSAQAYQVRLVDFNGDGRLDMVAIGAWDSVARVWLQSAGGTMLLHSTPAVDYVGWAHLAVGDVNGDGRPDFVVSGLAQSGRAVAVLLQQVDGSFAAPVFGLANEAVGLTGVAIGDFNGDSRQDIVATFAGNSPTVIGVFYQQADGQLGPMVRLASYDMPLQVAAADVNNDGRTDLVVAHWGWYSVGVYLQQADGTLAAESRYPAPSGSPNPQAMAVGDINGDGRLDVLLGEEVLLQRAVAQQAQAVRPSGQKIWQSTWRALGLGAAR